MVAQKQKLLIAIVAGTVVAGVALALIGYAADAYVGRLGREVADSAARDAVARAEARIGEAVAAMADVAKSVKGACSEADGPAIRRAVLAAPAIKLLSLVGDDAKVLCGDADLADTAALSRDLRTADPHVTIAIVRLAEVGGRALRITLRLAGQGSSVAALVPASLLFPALPSGSARQPTVRLMLEEGTVVGTLDPHSDDQADAGTRFFGHHESQLFPIMATASISRDQLLAGPGDLLDIQPVAGGLLAISMIALGIIIPWRRLSNPITEMERALEAGEFIPYYQPVVDMDTGRITGAEVLARWRKRDGTLIMPAHFVPLAESSGLLRKLTRSLMLKVREEVGEAVRCRPGFMIGFNLAASDFSDEAAVSEFREIFEGSPIPPSRVVLEITERTPLEDYAVARRIIAALQRVGFEVAIDDVGAGHGGLSYLLKLGVDTIKIDKMFVESLGSEPYSTTIIETLVDLARNMRMRVVAEGVESFEQVTYLRAHGIHLAQGYIFAPPLPGSSFLQLIAAADPVAADGLAAPVETVAESVASA